MQTTKKKMLCEKCGSEDFNRVKPKEIVAFSKDYQCVQCQLQFPAPVPIWGSLLFMITGIPLAAFGAMIVAAVLLKALDSRTEPNLVPLGIGMGLCLLGSVAFWKGVTSLKHKK
jgi:hypothetical protein